MRRVLNWLIAGTIVLQAGALLQSLTASITHVVDTSPITVQLLVFDVVLSSVQIATFFWAAKVSARRFRWVIGGVGIAAMAVVMVRPFFWYGKPQHVVYTPVSVAEYGAWLFFVFATLWWLQSRRRQA